VIFFAYVLKFRATVVVDPKKSKKRNKINQALEKRVVLLLRKSDGKLELEHAIIFLLYRSLKTKSIVDV
jgi:hypothetical protein